MTRAQLYQCATGRNARLLTARQREVVRLISSGLSFPDAAAEIGISEGRTRAIYYAGRARLEGRKAGSIKYDRDSDLDAETPRETEYRIRRELADGLRCRHPMLSGGPCSLLLPCHTHGGR